MIYSYKYIEEKSEQLLRQNGLFKPGFDIKKLTAKLKIELLEDSLGDDVSGYFVINNGRPLIAFQKNDVPNRSRFTIAHELGHYILHSKDQSLFIDKAPKVLYRNSASSTGAVHKEREANTFAASLLMPRELVRSELDVAPPDIDSAVQMLSDKFKVSAQAMSFRLSYLGYDIG